MTKKDLQMKPETSFNSKRFVFWIQPVTQETLFIAIVVGTTNDAPSHAKARHWEA